MDKKLAECIQQLYSLYPKPGDKWNMVSGSRIHHALKPVLRYLCQMNGQCFPPLSEEEREEVALRHHCPRCQRKSILTDVDFDQGIVHMVCEHCDWETNELLSDMKEAGYDPQEYF